GVHADPGLASAVGGVALVSIPPDAEGDPTLRGLGAALRAAPVTRIVYLSTVGVYGDSAGAWVDEASPLRAVTPRARARVAAEADWRRFGREAGVPVDILRLGGIYGPGRGAFDRLREGTARRVVKPGQMFNRIHVDDIAAAVEAVVAAARPGEVYNVVDGAPAPPQDVIAHAASLLGLAAPPEEPFATSGLTGMARSFYDENRRVRNERLRALGWAPIYRSYREGLAAVLAEEGGGR
ncbi:MAG: NAD-dependent epimerase/dehydratase family protein, partial [Pseudomonadota bacterium]|nr:NAD-dependent epimerase/dehydratase family protein [Pseudomonadota bacterium]